MTDKIVYPYLPEGRTYLYEWSQDHLLSIAKNYARRDSLDKTMPGAAVIVSPRVSIIIGAGANGSNFHETHGCERVRLGCKTGEGYELCEGCHPKNHSEAKALRNAHENGQDTRGAALYLWGHWWCCKYCWTLMISAGIAHVILLEDSHILFNKEHPNNIVGRQFSV